MCARVCLPLLSPLCYVTLQSNYRVCALFRGCLIMLFGLCRALGCHRVCLCVFVSLCVAGEKTLIVEAVLMVQQLSERERGREREGKVEREERNTSLSISLWPFLLIFYYLCLSGCYLQYHLMPHLRHYQNSLLRHGF